MSRPRIPHECTNEAACRSCIRVFVPLFVDGSGGQNGEYLHTGAQYWYETLVAATIDRHILVCGLGRIGCRVAETLAFEYGQTVVGVNDVPSPLVQRLKLSA